MIMDVFGKQILDAISKIRKRDKRPDAETIFEDISSNSASNICMNDVTGKLQELINNFEILKNARQIKGFGFLFYN